MTSSSTKNLYILPGEQDSHLSIVHHHGIFKNYNPSLHIYKPKENDFVIGIIIVRTPDLFLVDINSPEPAILPTVSFDNNRVPSRQTMNRFSVVCARVLNADKWIQTELTCQTPNNATKRSNLGLIQNGHLLRCSLELCQKLQQSSLIHQLNQLIDNFHIRITRNGFIWYNTDSINSMIAIQNVIYKYEVDNDINSLINFYKIILNKLNEQEKENKIMTDCFFFSSKKKCDKNKNL